MIAAVSANNHYDRRPHRQLISDTTGAVNFAIKKYDDEEAKINGAARQLVRDNNRFGRGFRKAAERKVNLSQVSSGNNDDESKQDDEVFHGLEEIEEILKNATKRHHELVSKIAKNDHAANMKPLEKNAFEEYNDISDAPLPKKLEQDEEKRLSIERVKEYKKEATEKILKALHESKKVKDERKQKEAALKEMFNSGKISRPAGMFTKASLPAKKKKENHSKDKFEVIPDSLKQIFNQGKPLVQLFGRGN